MFPGESVVALTGQTQSAEVTAPFQEAGYRTMTAAFHLLQDGTIKYEIKLTGELSTNPLSFGEESPEYGTLVMEGVNAQHHQHMFCARLDMAVDDQEGGKGLYVSEVTCCAALCCAVVCIPVACCAMPCCAKLQLPSRTHATVCLIRRSCKQTPLKAYAVVVPAYPSLLE